MQGNGDPRQSRRASIQLRYQASLTRSRSAGTSSIRCLLPKILDRILQMGGTLRDPRVQDRRPPIRPELCPDRDPGRQPRGDRRDPRRPGRARRFAGASRGRPDRPGRHRRRLPRGLLQHDQPAHPGPPQGSLDRRAGPGDGLRHRARPRDRQRPGACR